MKEYKIEITIDKNGDIEAETKGIQGKICVKKLESILEGISGEREEKNTDDYYKETILQQTIKSGI